MIRVFFVQVYRCSTLHNECTQRTCWCWAMEDDREESGTSSFMLSSMNNVLFKYRYVLESCLFLPYPPSTHNLLYPFVNIWCPIRDLAKSGKNSCNISLVQWIFDNNEFLALIFDTNYFWTTFGTFFIWFWQLLIGKEYLQFKFVALTWGFPKGCCTNEKRPRCWSHPPCCGYVACHSRRRHHLEIKIANQRRIVNRNENVVNPKINICQK